MFGRRPTCRIAAPPSGRRDSNPRPSPWQGDALPAEPRPHASPEYTPGRSAGSLRRCVRTVSDPGPTTNSEPKPRQKICPRTDPGDSIPPLPLVSRPTSVAPAAAAGRAACPVPAASTPEATVLYWCRWRSRQDAIGVAGVADRSRRLSKCPVPDPLRPRRRAVARQPQALRHCEAREQARRSPMGPRSREPATPEATEAPHSPPQCANGPEGRLATESPSASTARGRGQSADAKAPGGQDGYRAGGSDYVAGDEGISVGGPGGPEGRPPCGDLGEVPIAGDLGGGPPRGQGGPRSGDLGEVPVGERPGGLAAGGGETRPPRGEEGTRGEWEAGEAPYRGEEGSFPGPLRGHGPGRVGAATPA